MATGTNEWLRHRGRRRVTDLQAATTIGVCLLILRGGTAAIPNASAACPTWPTCQGRLFVPLSRTDAVIDLAHRALARLAGIALAGVVGLAHLDGVPVRNAVLFGLALTAASAGVFLAFTNVLAAVLGMLAILFHSVVYTVILKPLTDQNIVVGAVGAFPGFIGWAAVRETVGLPAVVLDGIVSLWTPAHFSNLALRYRDDYARADFPMLPIVRGETTTLRHVLLHLGATMLGVAALGATTPLGQLYAIGAVVAGAGFLWAILGQYGQRSDPAAVRAFTAANACLGVLLLVTSVDAAVLV